MRVASRVGGVAVFCCVVVLCSRQLAAAEATGTPEQIQAWIKQLGNEDFQKREEARASLLKAGPAAMAALKQAQKSEDNEIRNAAALLVGQLQWSVVPQKLDYLRLFPSETLFAAQFKDADGFAQSALKTSLLKLFENPDFKPLTDMVRAKIENGMGPALPLFKKWMGHFSGQMAGAVWAMNPMDPAGMRMAVVAELKADAVEKVFQEFLGETQMMKGGIPTAVNGLTILKSPNEIGAIALVGRHVVLGFNVESVRIIAENMLEPPADGMAAKPTFAKALAATGGAPDFVFAMDFQQYLKFIAQMAPAMGPQGPKMSEMMRKLGYDGMEILLLTTRVVGDRFEDRFTLVLNEKPSKLVELMSKVYSSGTDLKTAFAVVPAEAVAAGNGRLDGAAMYQFVLEWVKELVQLENPAKAAEIDQQMAAFEQLTSVKLADVAGTIKGDMAYWVELAPTLAPPHLGFCLQCPDAAKANELAGYVGKYLDVAAKMMPPPGRAAPKVEGQDPGQPAKPPAPVIQKVDFKGHAVFTEAPESPLVTVRGRESIPYRLTWAVHGNRVLFTSSMAHMEQRLTALDAGTPGLDPVKLLPANAPEAAAIKTLMLLDMKRLMDYGAKFGLPFLALAAGEDQELQAQVARLTKLAAEKSLFEGLPPLVAVNLPPQDKVYSTVIWTPTPYLPTVFAGAMGAGFLFGKQPTPGGRGVRPPAPPPDVKF